MPRYHQTPKNDWNQQLNIYVRLDQYKIIFLEVEPKMMIEDNTEEGTNGLAKSKIETDELEKTCWSTVGGKEDLPASTL